jgi:hypothetical protein
MGLGWETILLQADRRWSVDLSVNGQSLLSTRSLLLPNAINTLYTLQPAPLSEFQFLSH